MFYVLVFVLFLFFSLIFSLNPSPNEKCFDNFCFIEFDGTCPSPYKPLEFPDKQPWESFKKFIKQNSSYSNKYFRLNLVYDGKGWEWVDGEKYNITIDGWIENRGGDNTLACWNGTSISAQPRDHRLKGWICQEEDCYKDDDSCYEVVDGGKENKTWYEAMNDCVEKRKRLASFKNNQIPQKVSTKINQPTNQVDGCYWIGLILNNLKWESSNQMVTFNQWKDGYFRIFPGFCYHVETNSISWNMLTYKGCYKFPIEVMCMREKQSPTTLNPIINMTTNNYNNNNRKENNYNSKDLGLGLGLGIPLVIFIIISIIFIILYIKLRKIKTTSCPIEPEKDYYNNEVINKIEESTYPSYQKLSPPDNSDYPQYQELNPCQNQEK